MAAGALQSTLALRGDRWTGIQLQQERGIRRLKNAGTTPRIIRMIRCRKATVKDAKVKDREGTKHNDTLAQRGRRAGAAAALATTMMDAFQDTNAKLQEHRICCAAMHCVYCDVLPKSRNCQARALSSSPSWSPELEGASLSDESKKPLRLSSTPSAVVLISFLLFFFSS